VLSVVIGFCGTQGMMRGLDMAAAVLDLKAQISTLEEIAQSGGYTQPAALDQMQKSLQSMDGDLVRLQSDVPLSWFQSKDGSNGVAHMLRMATLLVRAGEYGVDAGQVLMPAIHGMISGLGSSTAAANGPPTISTDDLKRVTADVDIAGALVKQALQERRLVSDSQLNAIGLGKAVGILHKLDSIAPKLPEYLVDMHYAAAALPSLFGLKAPIDYLLFSQDSDELRPTGGFMGNYALLTFAKGRLTSGVHLTDIYKLDCPGGYPDGCKPNPIPRRFAWLSDDPNHFAVRDSNLDPDFATSAHYIEENYHRETGKQVSGVISFTPAFIGKVLDAAGGITLPGYGKAITSANLQDTIHYYHILYAYCTNASAHAAQSVCRETTKSGSTQTSDKKSFDAALGATLLHTVASGGGKVQGKVIKAALEAITTRDLQIYFNDAQVESLLKAVHADNSIPEVKGDQLLTVDVNTGATYASGDLNEQVQDTITLNPDGSAYHDLTITYTYPWRQHQYAAIYAPAVQPDLWDPWQYAGVLLVMVPETAWLYSSGNCGWPFWHRAEQPDRAIWNCAPVYVNCNACALDGTNNGAKPQPTAIHLRWVVPHAVNDKQQYNLTLVHQAGSHSQVTVTIVGANGRSLVSASADNPKLTAQQGGLQFSTPVLTTDQNIVVAYK
jgi:hypothetical protein